MAQTENVSLAINHSLRMQTLTQIELLLIGGFIAVLSGAITSLLSTQFALKRFYAEKWWTMKVEAYSKIMEALHYTSRCYSVWSEAELSQTELLPGLQKQLSDDFEQAYRELRKATGIGAFIISENAADLLTKLAKRRIINAESGWQYEVLSAAQKAHSEALAEFRRIAKEDLRSHRM
jgi:hypothetical protein